MQHPVVLFCYNRPDHLRETLAALAANKGAADTPLVVFSDGPAHPGEKERVARVRALLTAVEGFLSVEVHASETNLGLAQSVIRGVGQVLERYPCCIVLEDDLRTAPYFIDFMNKGLNRYWKDERIFSISGYCPPIDLPEDFGAEAFLFARINSWGWATWQDRWKLVDWDLKEAPSFLQRKSERSKLAAVGKDLPVMLLRQLQGKLSSWAIRFNQACFMLAKTNVYPSRSLVANLGADGSGTHMKNSARFRTTLSEGPLEPYPALEHPKINAGFERFYRPSWHRRLRSALKLQVYLFKNRPNS